jgi:hypothetical protein
MGWWLLRDNGDVVEDALGLEGDVDVLVCFVVTLAVNLAGMHVGNTAVGLGLG